MLGLVLIFFGIMALSFAVNSPLYLFIGIGLIWWGIRRLGGGAQPRQPWGMNSGKLVSEELTGQIVRQVLDQGCYEHFSFRIRPSGDQTAAYELVCARGMNRSNTSEQHTFTYRFAANRFRTGNPREQRALLEAIRAYLPFSETYQISRRGSRNTLTYIMTTSFYDDKRWNQEIRSWEYR